MKATQRILIILISAIAVLVVYLCAPGGFKRKVNSPQVSAPRPISNTDNQTSPLLDSKPEHLQKDPGKESSTQNAAITQRDEQLINEGLKRLESALKEREVKNHKIIYELKRPGSTHLVMMRIPPPDADQLGQLVKQLTDEADRFPPDSPSYKKLRESGLKLLDEYAFYKKATKVIQFGERPDGSIWEFFEYYVDDEKVLLPDANGNISVVLGNRTPDRIGRMDTNFGGPDSWAAKRYSHLLKVENAESDQPPSASK